MELDLRDKIVFISGSSRGLGKATAHRFLEEECYVVITGRNQDSIHSTSEEFINTFGEDRILSISSDLTTEEGVNQAVNLTLKRWKRIDILVANVGGTATPGWDISTDEWQSVLDTNFLGSMKLCRAVIPKMIETNEGNIIFVSSIAGLEDLGAPITYAAAKSALTVSAQSLARILGKHKIRVNAVAPGNLLFPGGAWERKLAERGDFFQAYVEREVALQRFGKPEEVANVIAFLASSQASFVTGACWVIDGGQIRSFG